MIAPIIPNTNPKGVVFLTTTFAITTHGTGWKKKRVVSATQNWHSNKTNKSEKITKVIALKRAIQTMSFDDAFEATEYMKSFKDVQIDQALMKKEIGYRKERLIRKSKRNEHTILRRVTINDCHDDYIEDDYPDFEDDKDDYYEDDDIEDVDHVEDDDPC